MGENVCENHSLKMTPIQAARISMQTTTIWIAEVIPCLCEVLWKMVTK